jgi:hypothetical protein
MDYYLKASEIVKLKWLQARTSLCENLDNYDYDIKARYKN